MKTVIEMACEANIKQAIETPHLLMVAELERFAELVRADERKQVIAKNAPEIERLNAYIKDLEHQAARYKVLRTWDLDGRDYGLYSPEEIDKAVDGCIKE